MANVAKSKSEFVTRYTATYFEDDRVIGTIQFLEFEFYENPNVMLLKKARKPGKNSGPFKHRALYFVNTGLLAMADRELTETEVEVLNNRRRRAKQKTGT